MEILQVTKYIECILQIGVKNMIRTQSDACHKINICATRYKTLNSLTLTVSLQKEHICKIIRSI